MDTSEAAEATGGTAEGLGSVSANSTEGIVAQDAQIGSEGLDCTDTTGDVGPSGSQAEALDTHNTLSGYTYDPMETVSEESLQVFAAEANQTTSEFAQAHGKIEDASPLEETDVKLCRLPDKVYGGHSMDTQQIYVNDVLINEAAHHTLDHEHMHNVSKQGYQHFETDTQEITVKTSGIHAVVENINKESGEIEKSDYHRALNEGLTERYTLQMEREMYGDEVDCGVRAYTENMTYASALFDVAGEQVVDNAYFNGELGPLSQQMNDMLGDNEAWSEFSRNVDIVCAPIDHSMSPEDIEKAVEQKTEARENLDQILLEIAKVKGSGEK